MFLFLSACGGGSSSLTSLDTSSTGVLAAMPTDEVCTPGSLLDCAIEHNGLDRRFKIYEPSKLSPNVALPVLFNFHGYGSNADQQLIYGDFRGLADEEAFILVVPKVLSLKAQLIGIPTQNSLAKARRTILVSSQE